MESERECVRVASIPSSNPKPKPKRKSSGKLPSRHLLPQGKKIKRNPIGWYSLKEPGIIGERKVRGEAQYLVDWADNPDTGEQYSQTWEWSKDIARDEISAWRTRQRQRLNPLLHSENTPPSQESEPVRPRKRVRLRLTQPSALAPQDRTPAKKRRRVGTAKTARFQAVSQKTCEAQGTELEIPDSYEEEQLCKPKRSIFGVVIPIKRTLNAHDYQTVVTSSSQQSESTHSYQNPPATTTASSPQLNTLEPSYQPLYVWDTDLEGVIPDSQELPGSSSYEPSRTPCTPFSIETRGTAAVKTVPKSEIFALQRTQSNLSCDESDNFDSSKGRFAQPLSIHPRAGYNELQFSSSLTEDSRKLNQKDSSVESQKPRNKAQTPSTSTASPDLDSHHPGSFQPLSIARQKKNSPRRAHRILAEALQQQALQTLPEGSQDTITPLQNRLLSSKNKIDANGRLSDNYPLQSPDHIRRDLPQFYNQQQGKTQTTQEHLQQHLTLQNSERSAVNADILSDVTRLTSLHSQLPHSHVLIQKSNLTSQADQTQLHPPWSLTCSWQPSESHCLASNPQEQLKQITNRSLYNQNFHSGSDSLITSIEETFVSTESHSSSSNSLVPKPSKTHGSTLPSQPSLGSDSDMEERHSVDSITPSPSTDPRQLLKLRRQQAIDKRAAEQAAESMASSLPPPSSASPAQPLPVRESLVGMAVHVVDKIPPILSAQASPEPESASTSLSILPLGQDEYIVPLPMVSYTRSIYVQTIKNYKSQISTLLQDEAFDQSLVADIDVMLRELDTLCSHQDLIATDFSTQRMESDDAQAKYAETISTKCIFLAEFFKSMRQYNHVVAVIVQSGRMVEILESILRRDDYVYHLAGRSETHGDASRGPLRISVIPSTSPEEAFDFEPVSVVIAFDSTVGNVPNMSVLRSSSVSPRKLAPLLNLRVTNSIEHLDLCFDKSMETIQRKIRLVYCLWQLGDDVGKFSAHFPGPPEAAKELALFVANGSDSDFWPLFPMPEIERLALSTEFLSDTGSGNGHLTQLNDSSASFQVFQPGIKRVLIDETALTSEFPKRQRLSPFTHERVDTDRPFFRGANSLALGSHSNRAGGPIDSIVATTATDLVNDGQVDQVSSLLQKVSCLEHQLHLKELTEADLRQLKNSLEDRINDREASLQDIQPKYQEALNDRGRFEHEMNEALRREATMRQQLEAKTAELTKIKEQRNNVSADLSAARTALASSTTPGVPELEQIKEELRDKQLEIERLQKRLSNSQGDLDYMRNNYQNASSSAVESASELFKAKSQVESLRANASENRVRIHEIQSRNEVAQYLGQIKQLTAESEEMSRILDKREEELRALMNGRRATRGTSVPRSPRMGGATMSPGPSRPIGRILQVGNMGGMGGSSSRSRGNSPAPGDVGASGSANFKAFGDALFPTQGSAPGGRWANHLQ